MKHSAIGPKTTGWQPAHASAGRRETVRKTLFAALFGIILFVLFIGSAAAVKIYYSGNYAYTLTDEGNATITNYFGEDVDLIVPDTLDSHPVVAIGYRAFSERRELGTLVLPDTVERIGDYAFDDCDLLTSIMLPAGLGEIGVHTFYSIPSLEHLYLAAENETFETIDGVLFNSASKALICYPQAKAGSSFTVPEGTLSIAPYAFEGFEALTTLTLPGDLQSIGIRAFAGCTSLTSISFPCSLQSIGGYAFEDCTSLTSISLPSGLQSIGSYAFKDCTSLTSISLPSGLQSIERGTFHRCESLSSIAFPDGLLSIAEYAFSGCTSLTSISLPASVQFIGSFAFDYCTSLISVTLPDDLSTLERNPFWNCRKLDTVELSADNENYTVVDSVLFDKTNTTLLIYPAGKKEPSYTVPDDVTTIGSYAFGDCPFLESIILPDSLLFIEPEAFYKLDSLTSITLPENIQTIGDYAFQDCSSLASIALPKSLQTIGDYAFEDCSSLASISLPEGLQTIGDYAFDSCDSLKNITLPQGIVSIGANPFAACEQLVSIQLSPGSETYAVIDNVLFDTKWHVLITYPYAKPDTSYTVPQGIVSIGEGAFYGSPSLTRLILPETLLYIDHNAIDCCNSLTSFTLPEGLLFLGWENFCFCDNLILTVHEGTYAQEYAETYAAAYELAPADTSRYSTETVVEVYDAVSLLAAIRPNTTIHLLPGDYNLSADAVTELLAEGNGALSPYVSFDPDFSIYHGILISDVENLTMIAEDRQELYTTNIDETVLIFNNCSNINISRLSMGHRPEKATACTAGVIAIVNCEAFSFFNCVLYGCGYLGAHIENSSHVVFFMCEIRDCSNSAVYMRDATNILFDETYITGNGTKSRYAYNLFWMKEGTSHVTFQYCSIDDNGNANTYSSSTALFRIEGERDTLTIRHCSFENNLYDEQIQIIH